ncbi:hypothetical protein [Dyadobacter frigoris]|uniref:hypothetical protein n=1 Tax=Dyadobacter frigoris TaxID=2576211 RepID=UPI001E55ECA1|nr:hypothetical protein [Dyadobacter frigoris]
MHIRRTQGTISNVMDNVNFPYSTSLIRSRPQLSVMGIFLWYMSIDIITKVNSFN